jgi:hypothetical protein
LRRNKKNLETSTIFLSLKSTKYTKKRKEQNMKIKEEKEYQFKKRIVIFLALG